MKNDIADFDRFIDSIELSSLSGVVLASDKSSETRIEATGGGALGAPRLSSSVIAMHEFWIRASDGTEHSVSLNTSKIPLRIGQDVTILMAGPEKTYIALINHSSNTSNPICSAEQLLAGLGKKYPMTGLSILALIAGAMIGLVFGRPGIGLSIAVVFLIWRAIRSALHHGKRTADLQHRLDRELVRLQALTAAA